MLFAVSAYAADVSFEWDYTPSVETPQTGFELHLSAAPSGLPSTVTTCPSSPYICTIPNIVKGTWYVHVHAFAVGDIGTQFSNPSNEISFAITGSPSDPRNIRIKR